jgi:D-beta-D-heptose 7-phosphate kinase/D-beta-D-heptose 1-phosphate adenosyltransferase
MENYKMFESFPRMNFVRKDWGYEIWFFNTNELCFKLLVVYPGWTCSYHEHDKKYEIFYILDSDYTGRLFMTVDGKQKAMNPGEYVEVQRGVKHEFMVRGDNPGAFLEISTKHRDDDSFRHTVSRLINLGQEGYSFMGELQGFRDVKVLFAGDIMWDVYWSGPTKGLSPEAPVPNTYPENMWEDSRPGGLGNVICNALSLGAKAACVGFVGLDLFGEELMKSLNSSGCETKYIHRIEGRRTTTKIRVMDGPHHHCRVNFEREDDLGSDDARRMAELFYQAVDEWNPDIIYFADYDKGVLCPAFLSSALDTARDKGVPTIADPKLAHAWDFKGVSIYKPNINRLAATLDNKLDTESDIDWAAEHIFKYISPEHVLITRGAQGMSLYEGPTGMKYHIPGQTVRTFELSGAGDTVGAVISLAYGSGMNIKRACEIANVAGSLVVQKPGTATLTVSELMDGLKGE